MEFPLNRQALLKFAESIPGLPPFQGVSTEFVENGQGWLQVSFHAKRDAATFAHVWNASQIAASLSLWAFPLLWCGESEECAHHLFLILNSSHQLLIPSFSDGYMDYGLLSYGTNETGSSDSVFRELWPVCLFVLCGTFS
jgi:hypothetical protein